MPSAEESAVLSYNIRMYSPSAEWVLTQIFRVLLSWYERRGKVKRLEKELAECKEAFVNLRLAVAVLCVGLGIYMLYASRSAMTRA